MGSLELLLGPGIDPECGDSPALRPADRDSLSWSDWRLPRNAVAIVNRLPNRRQQRESKQDKRLPGQLRDQNYRTAAAAPVTRAVA